MKKWQKIAFLAAGTLGIVYGMVYVDVVLRAKEAYQEGEKYWRWYEHPEERQSYLDAKLAADKAQLEKKYSQEKISKEDYDRDLELLQFDHEQALKESNIKYAYVW